MFSDIFSRSQVYFIFIMTGELSKCFKIKNLSPTIFQLMTFLPNSIEAWRHAQSKTVRPTLPQHLVATQLSNQNFVTFARGHWLVDLQQGPA